MKEGFYVFIFGSAVGIVFGVASVTLTKWWKNLVRRIVREVITEDLDTVVTSKYCNKLIRELNYKLWREE